MEKEEIKLSLGEYIYTNYISLSGITLVVLSFWSSDYVNSVFFIVMGFTLIVSGVVLQNHYFIKKIRKKIEMRK